MTGLKTSTYNSAGLHPKTVEREAGSIENANKNVTSRHVKGEILTRLQSVPGAKGAAGDLSSINPTLEGGSIDKHGMEHVVAAIEDEQQQDETFIEQALSGEEVSISVKQNTRRGSRQRRVKVKY